MKTLFQQKTLDKKESIYYSSQKKPLGKIPDQTPNLPPGTDIYETKFGKVEDKS